ncbi:MAG: ABC transporter ATP-binding protein [Bacteroidota bacterium]
MSAFISVENLGLVRRGKDILKNINLNIRKGSTLAILGPNGAGKSTLLELLLADFKPSSGSINYGFNKRKVFKNHVGVVYNNQHIFPQLYIYELMDFYKSLYRSDGQYLDQLIKLFDLERLKHSFIYELSSGEKKKLSIALALFHNPQLMVMDEPFANVDITIIPEIWEEIKKAEATTILATHDWSFAEKYADEILFLDHGQMLCEPFVPSEKNNILSAQKKLVMQRNEELVKKLPENNYYEKDEELNILLTPNVNLKQIKKFTFNYSILDISVKDVFYYLSLSKR